MNIVNTKDNTAKEYDIRLPIPIDSLPEANTLFFLYGLLLSSLIFIKSLYMYPELDIKHIAMNVRIKLR